MDNLKIKKFALTKFSICLSVFILLTLIIGYINFMVEKKIPNNVEFKSIDSKIRNNYNSLGFKDLQVIKNENKAFKVTGYREAVAELTNSFGAAAPKVKVVLTDKDYPSLYQQSYMKGAFFDERAEEEGHRLAVISESLARELFKSFDVIGNDVIINGQKYNIIGVYEKSKSFLQEISEDGYERVFIPYTAIDGDTELPLDVLSVGNIHGEKLDTIKESLKQSAGSKLVRYSSVEYVGLKNKVFQVSNILFFIIGIITFIMSLQLSIKQGKGLVNFIKYRVNEKYLFEIIKADRKKIVVSLCKIIVFLIAGVVVLRLVKFKLIFSDQYIPSDNIFDLNFYREKIISVFQLSNANGNGISNVYDNYIASAMKLQSVCAFSEIVIFIELSTSCKLLCLIDGELNNIVKQLIIAVSAGFTLALLAYIASMINIAAVLKSLVALTLYVLFYFYSKREVEI